MMFENREQAAHLLAGRMHHLRGSNPLILAIPRGGVPMGKVLADSLGGDLDVILVRKLGFPHNPEVAIGAVNEEGTVFLNEHLGNFSIADAYIQRERERQLKVLESRRELYTPVHPMISPKGRTVVVVDDGTATGVTMTAALHTVRKKEPRSLIAAVAVAPPDAIARIQAVADECICLHTPESFMAVGQYFADFSQVTDEEVIRILSLNSMAW